MGPWVDLAWWQWVGIAAVSVWNALTAGVEAFWEVGVIFLASVLILTLVTTYLVDFTRNRGAE